MVGVENVPAQLFLSVLSFQALLGKVVPFTSTCNREHNWSKPAERMPSSEASGGLGLT